MAHSLFRICTKAFFGLIFLVGVSLELCAQNRQASAIEAWQKELNASYANRGESPLDDRDFKHFEGLPFYPIDTIYTVRAILEETPETEPFEMPTSTNRRPKYRIWGIAKFTLKGHACALPVYISIELAEKIGFSDYLFLPFTDETTGNDSYGGGRYLDLRLPAEGNIIEIDFNKAYNPYCAYSERYSCPLVPEANHLSLRIEAGVRAAQGH